MCKGGKGREGAAAGVMARAVMKVMKCRRGDEN